MIKFRQKEFVFLPAAIEAGVGAVGNTINTAQTNKSNERIADEQRKLDNKLARIDALNEKKNREIEKQKIKQQDKLINLAEKNPGAAAAIGQTINDKSPKQMGYSEVDNNQPAPQTMVGKAWNNVGIPLIGSGVVTTAMNMKMNKDQLKSNERIADKDNATKRAEIAAKMQDSKNNTAIKMQELNNQRLKFRHFSAVKEGAGFVKDLGTLAKDRGLHKMMAGALVAGAVAGSGEYLVDKAIQRDIKKNKILKVEAPEETADEKKAKKKKRNRKIAGSILGTAALVGTGIAAKKGKLGKDAQDIASKVTYKSIGSKLKSGAKTIGEATKDYFAPVDEKTGKRRVSGVGLGLTGLSIAAPGGMYLLKKKAIKDQLEQSEGSEEKEKTYSKNTGPKINLNNIRETGEKAYFQRNGKNYNGTPVDIPIRKRLGSLLKKKGQSVRMKAKDWFREFKKKPGETVLGSISYHTGGGGKKGVSQFGEDLEGLGKKSGNKASIKVGEFIKSNPKTALVGSIILGGVAIRKARNKVYGATRKAIEKVDPNAYAYAKYGAQVIPPKNEDEEENEEEKNNG